MHVHGLSHVFLFLINLTFHNLSLHSSYTIHQPFTDYFLRLPYSELLEKRLFRSQANRRLVLLGSKGSKIMMRHKMESLVRWTTAMSTLRIALVCRRFRRRSGRLWCRARSGSSGFRRRSRRLWCRARSSSTGFRRRFRTRSGRFW